MPVGGRIGRDQWLDRERPIARIDAMSQPRQAGAERRRHPRVALDWPVKISLPDGTHEARLRDISRAGVCFFLDRRIPEMTVLRMDLDLPPREPGQDVSPSGAAHVAGSGVVVRCQPLSPHVDHYEIAVFLNDLGESDRESLEAYVSGDAG
jgi:hypothetical protein